MPAQVFGFKDLPKDGIICLDTTFIIKIFGKVSKPSSHKLPEKIKKEIDKENNIRTLCKNYAELLRKSDTITVTCDCVIQECLFCIIQWKLMEESEKKYSRIDKWHEIYKKYPSTLKKYNNLVDDFFKFTEENGIVILDYKDFRYNEILSTNATDIIKNQYTLPMDAYIVEHSRKFKINTFASCDSDWERIDTIQLHSPYH